MNRQIRWVGLGIMVLFVVLFVQLNYLQVVHAPALDASPLNGEKVVEEYDKARGAIVSADGVTLAQSVAAPKGSEFTYQRKYPTGSLFGQVTGYYSFIYGSDGAEKTYDRILTGADSKSAFPTDLSGLRQLLTRSNTSQNITLTVSDKLQTLARNELAGRDGSVVAIDPSTGAILSMYSNPAYDPSGLSQLSTTQETRTWKHLLATPGNPLSPGTYRNRWFPGSTFKIVTAAAVYDHQPTLIDRDIPATSALDLPETTDQLHNFGGEVCGGALLELFTVSCDTGFGQLGLDLGASALSAEATSWGFDQTPPLDLPEPAQSFFPAPSSFDRNLPTLAFSAIGQENVSATPLEMAEIAGAVADHGTMMAPHVLARITNDQNVVVGSYKPKVWRQATSRSTAARLTTLMESVVDSPDGTGVEARIPGVEVAAKTGTAQTQVDGVDKIDAWFVAFAPAAHPTIAVAVLLPDQDDADEAQGGTLAAPIAKAMIEAYLSGGHEASTTTVPSSTNPPATTPTSATTSPSTAPATSTPTNSTPASATTSPSTAPVTTAPATTAPATTPPATSPAATSSATGPTTASGE